MDEWDWFRTGSHAVNSQICPKSINWSALAHDKAAALDMIRKDPNVLFKVVDSVSSCMCGGTCRNCELDDVVFLELLIEARTLTERDLCEIAATTPLNWHKICSKVPPCSIKSSRGNSWQSSKTVSISSNSKAIGKQSMCLYKFPEFLFLCITIK